MDLPRASPPSERKLVAILAADVVDYARLMELDEAGTTSALAGLRSELVDPAIQRHRGCVIRLASDRMRVRFSSALSAVSCAMEVQSAMGERNGSCAPERRIEFRTGIHVDEVAVEDGQLEGTLQIAARLQDLAPPGGICISELVKQGLGFGLGASFVDRGEQSLRNVSRSVRAYCVDLAPRSAGFRSEQRPRRGKPLVALLPFTNLSGQPDPDSFVQGVADELTIALARLPWFSMLRCTRALRSGDVGSDARSAAAELGAQYLIEGSARRAGARVRFCIQLIEGSSGRRIWAERYERQVADVFDLQDALCRDIVASLTHELLSAETQRAQRKELGTLDAWDYTIRARWHLTRFEREDNREAQHLLETAIELDPGSTTAYGFLAMAHVMDVMIGWSDDPARSLTAAAGAAHTGAGLDEHEPVAQTALGMIEALSARQPAAIARLRRTVRSHAQFELAYGCLGLALAFAARPDEAMDELATALSLGSGSPFTGVWLAGLAAGAFVSEDYRGAFALAQKAILDADDRPYPGAYRWLAAACTQLGRFSEAREALEALRARVPGLTLQRAVSHPPFLRPSDRRRFAEALSRAGLRES